MRIRLLIFFLLPGFGAAAQSKLGDMACVYVTSPNLDSSVAFYEKMGFPKIASNTFPVEWAQCSDGSLVIMMRKDTDPYIGLTYYVNDIDKKIEQLEKDSIRYDGKPSPGDPVKRYFITSPDGFKIMLVPNIGGFKQPQGMTLLNMPPADFSKADKYPNRQCGAFGEFCHPVADLRSSLAFWQKLGFTVKSIFKQPYPYAILSDGLMLIGLHQTKDFSYPAITYFGTNTEARIRGLAGKGITTIQEMQGKKNVMVKSWEGQHFFVFDIGM